MIEEAVTKPRLKLRKAAEAWSMATGRSLGALSSIVVNQGGVFRRVECEATGITDLTMEKFARFLIDPANWPADSDGKRVIPEQVIRFCHTVGVSAPRAADAPNAPRNNIEGARHG